MKNSVPRTIKQAGTLGTVALAAPIGAAWITHRRDVYRRFSEPLAPGIADQLRGYFSSSLLRCAEVARVPTIANPLGGLLSRFQPPGALDLSTVRGMAFIDTVVIAEGNAHHADNETSLLFHELVHLVQYQLLGTGGFVRAYLAGWLESGKSYLHNPMEAMAFELQDRFDRGGPSFDVATEVRRRLIPEFP